jgi:hypothetical protein
MNQMPRPPLRDRPDRARWAGPRLSRRSALTTLGGVGIAGLVLALVEPAERLFGRPGQQLPDWAYSMPWSGDAYAAALAEPDLLATLPCFCGCSAFEQPHAGLKDCFIQTSGDLDPHGAFCETCQEEALDAVGWARQGVAWDEIHDRIVTRYESRDPASGGSGCGGATAGAHEGAACTP